MFPPLPFPLILGSSSPFRRKVLHDAGLSFATLSPDIDEAAISSDDPELLARAIAAAKMDALEKQFTEPAIALSADQVVAVAGTIRGKPPTRERAREYLESYRHHYAETISAIVVANTATGHRAIGVDRARIFINPLDDETIEKILDEGTVFHCAGGFAIDHPLMAPFVNRIEGTTDSVIGMPLVLAARLIREVLGGVE